MASWGTKRIAGVTYDLRHLDPMMMEVTPTTPQAPTYRVKVSFGSHTFTKELQDAHGPDLRFDDGREIRCFCTERHGLSLQLPAIVTHNSHGRAYFSQTRNFLFTENIAGIQGPYVIFFNMERARKSDGFDAAMFVVSAYPKPALPQRLKAITFATLVSKTVAGEHIRRP